MGSFVFGTQAKATTALTRKSRRALPMNKLSSLASALCLALAAVSSASAAQLVLVSGDVGTGLGLEHPTPKAPEGLNRGTTLGEQRTLAYLFAAYLWGSGLESRATVYVGASFQPRACTPTCGTL